MATHWGYYWKIKRKNYETKALCDWHELIDSFKMFKNQEMIQLTKESIDRTSITIPRFSLKAILLDNDSLSVTYRDGSYIIPVKKKPCNYGGYYYFFHCPQCSKRMRKLYCIGGKYLCRKCGNLGYYTQRLRPVKRNFHMMMRIERYIRNRGGSVNLSGYIERKPLWMKNRRKEQLSDRLYNYREKESNALRDELLSWYPSKREIILRHIE